MKDKWINRRAAGEGENNKIGRGHTKLGDNAGAIAYIPYDHFAIIPWRCNPGGRENRCEYEESTGNECGWVHRNDDHVVWRCEQISALLVLPTSYHREQRCAVRYCHGPPGAEPRCMDCLVDFPVHLGRCPGRKSHRSVKKKKEKIDLEIR